MVKRLALLLVLVLLVGSSVHTTLPLRAEGKTIIVPDDYPTVSSAVKNAIDGDTVFIKNGTYETINQTLVINKSITLQGENSETTTINLNPPLIPKALFSYTYMGSDDALKIQANNVKITGLTLKTGGGTITIDGQSIEITNNNIDAGLFANGMYIKISNNTWNTPYYSGIPTQRYSVTFSGSHYEILNNTLNGIYSSASHSIIAANNITGTEIADLVLIKNDSNIIYGNNINADGMVGITLGGVSEAIIAKNVLDNSGIQISASNSIINGNIIKNNDNIIKSYMGICVSEGRDNIFSGNQIENNTRGICFGYDQTDIARERNGPNTVNNTVFHNNFINNKQQAQDWNWLGTNQWSKDKEGNYWSDYKGFDWNFDGIGDSPYRLEETVSYYAETTQSIDLHPLMTPFNIKDIAIDLPEWATSIFENIEAPDINPEKPTATFPMTLTIIIIVLTAICMIIITGFVYFIKTNKKQIVKI